MDKEKIVNQYQEVFDKEEIVPLYLLQDDKVVIGEEVDDKNRLWYVVLDRDNMITVETALNQKIIEVLKEREVKIITITKKEKAKSHIVEKKFEK